MSGEPRQLPNASGPLRSLGGHDHIILLSKVQPQVWLSVQSRSRGRVHLLRLQQQHQHPHHRHRHAQAKM